MYINNKETTYYRLRNSRNFLLSLELKKVLKKTWSINSNIIFCQINEWNICNFDCKFKLVFFFFFLKFNLQKCSIVVGFWLS